MPSSCQQPTLGSVIMRGSAAEAGVVRPLRAERHGAGDAGRQWWGNVRGWCCGWLDMPCMSLCCDSFCRCLSKTSVRMWLSCCFGSDNVNNESCFGVREEPLCRDERYLARTYGFV